MHDKDKGEKPRNVSAALAGRVKKLALESLPERARDTTNLYLDPRVREAGTALGPPFQRWIVDRPSVLVFEDEEPEANFGHPCSYLLFDAGTGAPLQQIVSDFPPYPQAGLEHLDAFWQPVKPGADYQGTDDEPRVLARRAQRAARARRPRRDRYAILFAGLADKHHLNDLELSYRMLVDLFDFEPDNIHVLFHDGRNDGRLFRTEGALRMWPGDNSPFQIKVNGEGTRSNFRAVLQQLGNTLGPNDLLFIHTEGHGGHDRGTPNEKAFLAGYSDVEEGSQYFADSFGNDLQTIGPACRSLLLLMNQCYAGGFTNSVLTGSKAAATFIACAATANKRAFTARQRGGKWNDFSLDWMEAQLGERVDRQELPSEPEQNPDGSVSALGAYKYAKKHTERRDSPNFGLEPDPDAGTTSLR
jgi:hypothetical protein